MKLTLCESSSKKNMYFLTMEITSSMRFVIRSTVSAQVRFIILYIFILYLTQLYITQSLRINWSGYISHEFAVSNGVKQSIMITPLLFAIYLGDLLLCKCKTLCSPYSV